MELFWKLVTHLNITKDASKVHKQSNKGFRSCVVEQWTRPNTHFFFFFFFKGCTHSIWKFLGQGLNANCGATAKATPNSLTYCTGQEIKPASPQHPELLHHGGNSSAFLINHNVTYSVYVVKIFNVYLVKTYLKSNASSVTIWMYNLIQVLLFICLIYIRNMTKKI